MFHVSTNLVSDLSPKIHTNESVVELVFRLTADLVKFETLLSSLVKPSYVWLLLKLNLSNLIAVICDFMFHASIKLLLGAILKLL